MAKPELNDPARKYVLLVEGYSDMHFYAEALEFLGGLHDSTFIKHFNGKPDLDRQVRIFWESDIAEVMAGPNPKASIGLIVDADGKPGPTATRFAKLLGELSRQTVKSGVWTNGAPRIGLYVTPDGKSQGEIETLVWNAWSESDKAAGACVDDFLKCMAKAKLKPKSPDKARVGALLAVCNDEDPRLGPGAQAGAIDFDWPKFKPLLNFLKQIA